MTHLFLSPRASIGRYPMLMLLLLFTSITRGQIYVDHTATGSNDGSSWNDAYTELSTALDNYNPNDEIWVAQGSYLPQQPSAWVGTPKRTFYLYQAVALYGGFEGTETLRTERDPALHETILSGDLNGDDQLDDFVSMRSDNVNNVVFVAANLTQSTIIDGFTISGGQAAGNNSQAYNQSGGGIWSWGSPQIYGCKFTQNYALFGAGGVMLRGLAASEASLSNCSFDSNQSDDFGGGLALVALDSSKIVQISNCQFTDNQASNAGGGFAAGAASFNMDNCQFNRNQSGISGGAVFTSGLQGLGSDFEMALNECDFVGNASSLGGAFHYETPGIGYNDISLSSCEFTGNHSVATSLSSSSLGGAIHFVTYGMGAKRDSLSVTDCLFQQNGSEALGGAFALSSFTEDSLYVEIQNCQFLENTSGGAGGAIYLANQDTTQHTNLNLEDCLFEENQSSNGGGVYYIGYGPGNNDLSIRNSDFLKNAAVTNAQGILGGGALQVTYVGAGTRLDTTRVIGCRFLDNRSALSTGGLSYTHAGGEDNHLLVDECEFLGNEEESGFAVGGLGIADGGIAYSVKVMNTLFDGNIGKGTSAFGVGAPTQEPEPLQRDVELINCLFINHHDNAGTTGVLGTNRSFSLSNCTLADNQVPSMRISEQGNIRLQNTILKADGFPNLISTVSQGSPILSLGGNMVNDASLGSYLIGSDQPLTAPRFEPGTYELSQTSTGVDAGVALALPTSIDFAGNDRIQGNGIDIGAIESPFASTTHLHDTQVEKLQISVYPNPTTHYLHVAFESPRFETFYTEVFNDLGQLVLKTIHGPAHALELDVQDLAPGSYRLKISDRYGVAVSSFIKN